MDHAESGRPAPGRTRLLLLAILVAGLAVRVWYLDHQLDSQRFWDERFSFDNVLALSRTGGLEPANGYYPLLSYLPQALLLSASDALHQVTGIEWLVVYDDGELTAQAYRLSRGVQAVWGLAAVWLTFLVGRRLFSPATGLVAATALAFAPGHIHASGVFKPDAPLVLAVLLAFTWSLAALRRPRAASYGLAGVGVALAMSTKLIGGLAALPLTLVSVARARREPRRLLLLALTGGVALALFLLLNPHWPLYFEYLEKLDMEYEWKASTRGMTRWQTPARTAGFLLRGLGPPAAIAAAIGAGLLLWRLVRRRPDGTQKAELALLLLLPLTWVAGYMSRTDQFKPNNFLPLLPFAALVAAWGLFQGWRWIATRAPVRGARRPMAAIGAALLLAALVPGGLGFVYRSLTPRAEDLALRFADRRLAGRRNCQLVYELGPAPWPPWERARVPGGCHLKTVTRLSDLEPEQLRLSDGVLFPQPRLAGAGAPPYLDAVAASDSRHSALYPRDPLRVRGPGFVAALHPWSQLEAERRLEPRLRQQGRFRVEADLPEELSAGEVLSFSVWLPRQALAEDLPPPELRTGGKTVELLLAGSRGRGFILVSPRMVNRRPGPQVRLNRHRLGYADGPIEIVLWRWREAR